MAIDWLGKREVYWAGCWPDGCGHATGKCLAVRHVKSRSGPVLYPLTQTFREGDLVPTGLSPSMLIPFLNRGSGHNWTPSMGHLERHASFWSPAQDKQFGQPAQKKAGAAWAVLPRIPIDYGISWLSRCVIPDFLLLSTGARKWPPPWPLPGTRRHPERDTDKCSGP